jgi:hypothetical protein
MRFREFKPTLLEFAPPSGNDEISQLINILRDPNEDPSLKDKVNELLADMLQTIQQPAAPAAQQPVQQPAPVSTQQPAQQAPVQQLQQPPVAENIAGSITQAVSANRAKLLALIQSNPDFQAAYNEIMAEKEQEVRTAVKSERKQGEQAVYELVGDIVKAKFSVNQKEATTGIINVIEEMLRAEEVSFKDMMEFLTLCKNTGVINTASMVPKEGSEGSIPLVDDKYQLIVSRLLSNTVVKVGNAAWGAGEAGLAFCGIGAHKEVSDISVGKTHIEVKAGSRKTDFFLKGTKGFGTQLTGLTTLVDTLNSVAAQNGMEQFAMSNQTGAGGIASVGYARLNGTRGLLGLNNYFMKMEKKDVANLLVTVLSQVHASNPKIVKKYAPEIKAAVNKDSSVDYTKLVVAAAKISFEYYETMENHDGLLLLNIPSFTYTYQSKGNADSFGELVSAGKIIPQSAIDFRTNSGGGLAYKILD